MKSKAIVLFELQVKRILEWSAVDASTRKVLNELMSEVAALADQLSKEKRA